MAAAPDLPAITAELAEHGLVPRGGFAFGSAEEAPEGPEGAPARSVLLIGQAGASTWPHFTRWLGRQCGEVADPLDAWSREVIGGVAARHGGRSVSPSDRPYLPFQRWATRAEGLKPSPLGILMHPDYGTWHAYRGALLFGAEIPLQAVRATNHLCDACGRKPCLSACPVGAYSADGFDHGACIAHVRSQAGRGCRENGCAARNACPHDAFRYPAEAQEFHMTAYMAT